MTTSTPDSGRHPEELLAAYEEGSLADQALQAVEDHLAECDTCRADVRLAALARERLRALPEANVPAATGRAVVHALDREGPNLRAPGGPEVGDRGSARRRGDASRWLAGLAAAAVVVGLIAVALPRLWSSDSGGSSTAARSEEAADAAAPAPAGSGPPIVERQDIDYEPAAVAALAADAARATASAGAVPEQAEARQPPGAAQAIACVRRWASAAEGATPIRIIEASYRGSPAYLGVARQTSPGEGSDRILVWVLAREACELISFTQRRA